MGIKTSPRTAYGVDSYVWNIKWSSPKVKIQKPGGDVSLRHPTALKIWTHPITVTSALPERAGPGFSSLDGSELSLITQDSRPAMAVIVIEMRIDLL